MKNKFEVGKSYPLNQQYTDLLPKEIKVLEVGDRPSGKARFIKYECEGEVRRRIIGEDNSDYKYFWAGTWSCRA